MDETWEWPNERFLQRTPALAAKIAHLIADESKWVDRRVETVSFVDENTLLRQTSVHFSVPNMPNAEFEPEGIALTLVPISMLRKSVLRNFSVRDESGRSLPTLTREQNAEIAAQILYQQAGETLEGSQDPDLYWEVKVTLAELAGVEKREPREEDDGEPIKVSGEARDRQSKRLVADETMFAFILNLSRQFLMLVPYELRPGETRLIKFAYEADYDPDFARADETTTSTRPFYQQIAVAASDFLQMFGLLDYKTGFKTPAVFDSQSYHVEVVSPSEMKISEAVLYRVDKMPVEDEPTAFSRLRTKFKTLAGFKAQRTRTASDGRAPATPAGSTGSSGAKEVSAPSDALDDRTELVDKPIATDRAADRAHPYTHEEHPPNADHAYVAINFCLRVPLVLPVLLLSAVTMATLAGGLVAHYHYELSRSGDTAAALIVALPTFFVPAVVPGSHRLVLRMFKGMRTLVFASAVVSFSAAVSLAIDLSTHARAVAWWFFFGASALMTLVAFLALVHSWWKTSPLRSVMRHLKVVLFVVAPALAVAAWLVRRDRWDVLGAGIAFDALLAATAAAVLAGTVGLLRVRQKR